MNTVLAFFRHGYDTAEIDKIKRMTEAQVLETLTIERSRDLGRPDPYQHLLTGRPMFNPYRKGRSSS